MWRPARSAMATGWPRRRGRPPGPCAPRQRVLPPTIPRNRVLPQSVRSVPPPANCSPDQYFRALTPRMMTPDANTGAAGIKKGESHEEARSSHQRCRRWPRGPPPQRRRRIRHALDALGRPIAPLVRLSGCRSTVREALSSSALRIYRRCLLHLVRSRRVGSVCASVAVTRSDARVRSSHRFWPLEMRTGRQRRDLASLDDPDRRDRRLSGRAPRLRAHRDVREFSTWSC